ncbi:MAG: hypothetical protein J5680_06950 [Neisseriaceae bacterium]|nr:hypothetical protein [Neisseriaceae bacterium]
MPRRALARLAMTNNGCLKINKTAWATCCPPYNAIFRLPEKKNGSLKPPFF